MKYSPEEVAEFARTYGEISVFYELVKRGIDTDSNAENCLVAIGNYKRMVPRKIRKSLSINVRSLEIKCREEIEKTEGVFR